MKGILFTESMFNAAINGTKTQTRRIVKPQPEKISISGDGLIFWGQFKEGEFKPIKPKYKVEEILYLQEPYCLDCDFIQHKYSKEWVANGKMRYMYAGDKISQLSRVANGFNVWSKNMPAEYARYFIEITGVRCERLQNISNSDCEFEGIASVLDIGWSNKYDGKAHKTRQEAYAALINKIHGKGTWESNPYVWVFDFELVNNN